MENLSEKALEVWGQLDDQKRKSIQKDNPFRADRNEAIRALRRQGVKMDIIAEITGFHVAHIKRIAGTIKPAAGGCGQKEIEEKIAMMEVIITDLIKEFSEIKANILTDIRDN